MRLIGRLALAIAILASPPAGGATIRIDTERHGQAVDIRASAVLDADAAKAWRVLTDYGSYPRFIPDLRVSRVVARRGPIVTVEQSGDARLWLLRMPLDITFEISEFPPDSLHSRAVAGSVRALESRYLLTPTASGVRLEYTGRVTPGFDVFGRLEEYAVRENIARQFRALVDQIERSGIAAGRPPAAGTQ